MGWLEELWQGTDSRTIWFRAIRQVQEFPPQGSPELDMASLNLVLVLYGSIMIRMRQGFTRVFMATSLTDLARDLPRLRHRYQYDKSPMCQINLAFS